MDEPRWLLREEVDVIHWELIEEHGGSHGIRDEDAIESALARPRHKWAYQEEADLPTLGVAYGYGLAKNHGYVDGNKRVAFFSLVLFLRRNGLLLRAPQGEVVQMMRGVAAGKHEEEDLARWVRHHVQKRKNPGEGDRVR